VTTSEPGAIVIRPAAEGDVDALVQLIHDLAEYERSPESVQINGDQLRAALFGPSPTVFAHVAHVAHVAEDDGDIVGMAIWFLSFSTWTGRNGIALEDLYVRPDSRSTGVGRALLSQLAAIARQRDYGRLDWSVLKWNKPAIGFYESLGAVPMDEWTGYRLEDDGIAALVDATGSS
jgi:GNAT superfamily N-acetyltransferase